MLSALIIFLSAGKGAWALALGGPEDAALETAARTRGALLASDAAAAAAAAARQAWMFKAQVEKVANENLKFVPLVEAEIAMARAAAETAKEKDDEATKLYEETRETTKEAAMKAAHDYFAKVQAAAAEGTVKSGQNEEVMRSAAEEAAGRSAARAAMPYHGNLLRLQRVVTSYEQHARAMALASNNLKGEAARLASSANQYQAAGQTLKANQMMMQVQSLFEQGERLKQQAEKLDGTARELYKAMPLYQQAEQAAVANAAAAANPPSLPSEWPQPY